jgi:hypothetical protein
MTEQSEPVVPQDDLAAVVGALVEQLPRQLPEVLALERFRPAAEALERLADPAWRARGVAACTPAEAARLAALVRERWAVVVDDLPAEA